MNNELEEIKLNDLSLEEQLKIVEKRPYAIQCIDNPCLEVQLKVVEYNPHAIQYITNPYKEVQLKVVVMNPYTIRFIKNPYKEVQLKAVDIEPCAIQFITNPYKEVQLKAVEKDGSAIRYIDNPCKEVLDLIEVILTSHGTIYRNKESNLFSIGCQKNITKEYFIKRIYNTDGGLEENPYRQEYLDILKEY